MQHDNRFVWLDLILGVSAVVVCAGHLQAAMFVQFAELAAPGIWERAFYFVTGLGNQAVMVFFVMSGFFVGGSVLKRAAAFSPSGYAIARLSRLWAVLVPALAFTALVDVVLRDAYPGILEGVGHEALGSGPLAGKYDASIWVFFGNLAFLQTIYVPVFGSNGVLWSLANEFWYYVMFPLLAIAAGQVSARRAMRWLCVALVLAVAVIFARDMLIGFVVWLFGVAVFVAYRRTASTGPRFWWLATGLVLFALSLVDARLGLLQRQLGVPSDLV